MDPKRMAALFLVTLGLAVCSAQENAAPKLEPETMTKIGEVDPRYLSYNIEMVEVTGGRFWAPYKSSSAASNALPDPNQPAGNNSGLYQFRPPIDLANPRLRKLAAALGPAYVRVSGTWANSTFFQNSDGPAPAQAPEGFRSVLTRAQWKGVIDFAHATDAAIVTSVAVSPGTRNAAGDWTPDQARLLFDYTKQAGGDIAASEFMNEPTFPGPGNAPKGYDAAAFARDAKIFGAFLRKESPGTVFLGPGSIGEGSSLLPPGIQISMIKTEDMLKGTGPIFDAFSYHFYGAVSRRCGGKVTVDQALTANWLDSTDATEAFYAELRDKYVPGKSMWLNETAEAACGGDVLAGQFVDVFRFLNQLGSLAQKGVKAVMHNTLAASDYGLLDENTLEPRADYWAAVLWKRTMGSTVLKPQAASDPALRVYAQCMKGAAGGVTILVLNTDQNQGHSITISSPAERYTLTSDSLTSTEVLVNGKALHVTADGSLPVIASEHLKAGNIELHPSSATFFAILTAGNASCGLSQTH